MSEATVGQVSWTTALEQYFKTTGEKAHALGQMHLEAEQIVSGKRTAIDLPVIVLSGITGFVSALSSSPMLSANQGIISVVLGIVSLFVSTLNTTGSYFQFAKRAEGHRIAGIQFGKMYRFLSIEMGLPRDERMQPHDLLKMTKESYDRLQEISPPFPDSVISKYRAKFKGEKDIAVPEEANGLERIQIFVEDNDTHGRSPNSPAQTVALHLPVRKEVDQGTRVSRDDARRDGSVLSVPPVPASTDGNGS
jgi:hypothetical protein